MTACEVVVDCFPEALHHYRRGWTIVAVDVIRATTTAVTAAWRGLQVFPAESSAHARHLAAGLDDPLLVGELHGDPPAGFHETNSPAAMDRLRDLSRPVVLLSTNGTRLLLGGEGREATYAACLRNVSAQVQCLVEQHRRVALIGAGSRGEFREEDAYGCALLAEPLLDAGYRPGGLAREVVDRWSGLPPEAFADGHSARYLRRTGQVADLDFVLGHRDDVPAVFPLLGSELGCLPMTASRARGDVEVVGT
ncbi:MAG: 2-phosphosulfolactate phosphatase [Marmoricola sp.]